MLLAVLLAAQAAQPSPDIELEIRATVREVRIEQAGEASLEMRAGPDGGTIVDVDKPETGSRRRLRNVDVRVKAEARIADPAAIPAPSETPSPQ
jgi:hypothetical protein